LLARRRLRFGIHASAGRLRRLDGMGGPEPASTVTGEAKGVLIPREPALLTSGGMDAGSAGSIE